MSAPPYGKCHNCLPFFFQNRSPKNQKGTEGPQHNYPEEHSTNCHINRTSRNTCNHWVGLIFRCNNLDSQALKNSVPFHQQPKQCFQHRKSVNTQSIVEQTATAPLALLNIKSYEMFIVYFSVAKLYHSFILVFATLSYS